jgi:hypothetical protein
MCGLCKDSCISQELECKNSASFNLETCECECYPGYIHFISFFDLKLNYFF